MTRKDRCQLQQKAFKGLMTQAETLRNQLCFTDVTLKCEDKLFPVHKVIVGSVSPFLREYFGENDLCKLLEIDFLSADVLESIVTFCYTGRVPMKDPNTPLLLELIKASRHLEIPILYNHYFKMLFRNSSPENLIGLWKEVEDLQNETVTEIYHENILNNLDTLKKTKEFLELTLEKLHHLLQQSSISSDQHLVVEAILVWVKSNRKIRECHLTSLLQKIDLENLDSNRMENLQDSLLQNNSYFQEHCNKGIEKILSEVTNVAVLNIADCDPENPAEKLKLTVAEDKRLNSQENNIPKSQSKDNDRDLSSKAVINITNTVKKAFIYGMKGEAVKIMVHDLNSGEMEELKEHPLTNVCRSAISSYNRCIYYFGGRDNYYNVLRDCHAFNVAENQWSQIASMKDPRYGAAAVQLGGSIYVAGGTRISGASLSVERYNPSRDEWDTVADLPFSNSNPQIFALDGRLCFVGRENMVLYNPEENTWTDGNVLPKEIMYIPIRVAEGNGKMYVLKTFKPENVYIFDPVKNTWFFETIPVHLVYCEVILNLQNSPTPAFLIVNDKKSYIYRPPNLWESFNPINLNFPTLSLVDI